MDIHAYQGWLFDLDGVLTKTAEVHASAWQQAFDGFLDEEAKRSGRTFAPFDPVRDYERYVDGEPRADGVRNFLAARGIKLPEGTDDDPPNAPTVNGVGNRKNALVLHLLDTQGVAVYDGAVRLVKVLRATGTPLAVVSASENTEAALDAAGIADLFDARIDGHVVKEHHLAGKPAPDSYLEGAKVLGVGSGTDGRRRGRARRRGRRPRRALWSGGGRRPPQLRRRAAHTRRRRRRFGPGPAAGRRVSPGLSK